MNAIGRSDRANHQYDLLEFWRGARAGRVPAVSFLKAPHYQDGHDGRSDPLHEQQFLVRTINRLQHLRQWRSMAIVIAYDDPGGWYDHVMPPILNHSSDPQFDTLVGSELCGQTPAGAPLDRCGYGLRLPLLVLSPFVAPNSVVHTMLDQSSILAFTEHNWALGTIGGGSFDSLAGRLESAFDFQGGRRLASLLLNPSTGQSVRRH